MLASWVQETNWQPDNSILNYGNLIEAWNAVLLREYSMPLTCTDREKRILANLYTQLGYDKTLELVFTIGLNWTPFIEFLQDNAGIHYPYIPSVQLPIIANHLDNALEFLRNINW